MDDERIIETGVGATLSLVCHQVAEGAGLAVLKGGVGIGKSFALGQIAAELEALGFGVVLVTATEATSGNINAFLRSILGAYHTAAGSSSDAEEAVWSLLASYPFSGDRKGNVLIVDEAQKLSGRVLETIRGLWDRGDAARRGYIGMPAFGCVLVGNPTFLSKGGAQRTASFEPLLDRLTHNLRLPPPSSAECRAYAASLYSDPGCIAELAEGGFARGTLRSMATAARQAAQLAGDGPLTPLHIRRAFKTMGAK